MLCRSKLKGSHNSLICPKRRLPETPEPSAAPPLPPLPPNLPPFYPPMMGAPPVDNKVFVVPYQDPNHLQRPFVNFLLIPEEVLQPTAPLDTLEEEEEREVFVHHHHHHHPRDKKKKRRKTKESVGFTRDGLSRESVVTLSAARGRQR